MSTIGAVQLNGIWKPVNSIPASAIETVASVSGYTYISPEDYYIGDPPSTPLSKLSKIFSGIKIPTENNFGIGVCNFPIVDSGIVDIINPSIVRIHDYNGGSSTWRSSWAKIEGVQGIYDWGFLDTLIDYFYSKGKRIILTLWGTPTWASARPTEIGAYGSGWPGASSEPINLTYWDTWCTTVATRYKDKITYYEIWNEPQASSMFSGTKEILSQMVRRASIAIKNVDANAKIISPAVTGLHSGGAGLPYLSAMLQASDGITGQMKDWIDIVGCHLYPPSIDTLHTIPDMIVGIRSIMGTLNIAAKFLWNTEFGIVSPSFSLLPEEKKIKAIQALITLSIANSNQGVDVSIWYNPDGADDFSFSSLDAATYTSHISRMMSGITVINKLNTGKIYATIGGVNYVW